MKTRTISPLHQLALAGAVLLLLAAAPCRAHAAFTLTLSQVGPNVVVNGSGTINISALTFVENVPSSPAIEPSHADLLAGPTSGANLATYFGLKGPAAFGSGNYVAASSGLGDAVGIYGATPYLYVPEGYTSRTLLTDSTTFANQTFASLGFTPGTSTYTWGSVANGNFDSLTVTSVVPEPSTWALLGLAVRRRSTIA